MKRIMSDERKTKPPAPLERATPGPMGTTAMSRLKQALSSCAANCGCAPQRYVLTFMCSIGVMYIIVLRLTLGTVISKLIPEVDICQTNTNQTAAKIFDKMICQDGLPRWSRDTKRQLINCFYYGYILAHLPGAYLARNWSGKYTWAGSILLFCVVFSLSFLAACNESPTYYIASIFFIGLFEGPTFPALGEILSRWVPKDERTLLTAMVYAGVQIGAVVYMSVADHYLGLLQWSTVMLALTGLGVLYLALWCLFCYDSPSQHPFISDTESTYLDHRIPPPQKQMGTPWREMVRSKAVWALVVAELGHDYGIFTIIFQLPNYYLDFTTVHFDQNGDLSSLPFLVMWLMAILVAFVSDKLISMKWRSITSIRRILATTGAVVPGIGMVSASYLTDKAAIITLITVSLAFMGCYYSSLRVNSLDLSSNHAATLMAVVNGIGSLAGFITPGVERGYIGHDWTTSCSNATGIEKKMLRARRISQWQNLFWIMFAILGLTNTPYILCSSGDLQPWDAPPPSPSSPHKSHTINVAAT